MNRTIRLLFSIAFLILSQGSAALFAQAADKTVTVLSQTAGPTPFINFLTLRADDVSALKTVKFEVVPKPGSVTRPVSAIYFPDYLEARGYLDTVYGRMTVPVFGLYPNYANTVNLTYRFTDDSVQTDSVTITTPAYDDPASYNSPTVLQPRTNAALSYDYFSIKAATGPNSPVIIDTDGAVRWVGTTGLSYVSSIFFGNTFYVPSVPAGSTILTQITRMDFDGSAGPVRDYSDIGVTLLDHHNYDPGKNGILIEVTTTTQFESIIYEIDTAGNILKTWNLADIISAAMTAGGDDPTQFVFPAPTDWFHNNAATYRKSDDSLIVSSRENFVIALDYETGNIKWILGDPAKHWYEFPSLKKYALALAPGSLPPIGQHAVSITHDDDLLLFDNGTKSNFQVPTGDSRTYTSPRKYQIDLQAMSATEVWNYPQNESIYSMFTGSVYEDDLENYFIDYSDITIGGNPTYNEFTGLDPSGAQVFSYRYPINSIGNFAWNGIPIHLENIVYTGPQTALAAGRPQFFTGEQALTNGVSYLEFPINGNVFGYYSYLSEPNYIYHFGLGYEYVIDAADGQHGVFLYDVASQDFFYTSPSFPFPYLYDFNLGAVLYYYQGTDDLGTGTTRYFYNFATGQIITK